jgi:serine/threonine protein kinase/WD40 repeat protein/tetratricopeptide (TPR) repeat protein
MDAMQACPSREQLGRLIAAELSEPERLTVENHVEACRLCQRVLEQLTEVSYSKEEPKPTDEDVGPTSPAPSSFLDAIPAPKIDAPSRRRMRYASLRGASAAGRPDEPWPDLPGYELVEVLGRGGMAVVYKARQRKLDRWVALKVMRGSKYVEPEQRARFQAEAWAVAQLQHPNIVQIYEVGESDGLPYLVLELVEGGSLARRLHDGPWPADQAAQLLEILARTAHFAHERQVIHRDLKPANILLGSVVPSPSSVAKEPGPATSNYGLRTTDYGLTPKITDFGLAKQLDANTHQTTSGILVGTPSYMAPEQAEGRSKEIGPATDVHALGVILYELLTGRPPFQGASTLQTLEQVRHQEPISLRRLQPDIPRDLEAITLHCLEKEPARRYPSALALAEDLCCFRQGKPIHARPVSRLERVRKWARRRPAVAALTLAVLGLVLLVTVAAPLVAIREVHLRQEALLERDKSRQLSANLAFDKGVALAEAGQADRGLLWMLEALKTASPDSKTFQRMIRWNLGAWLGQVHKPLRFIEIGPSNGLAFSPDGRSFAAGWGRFSGSGAAPIDFWDTASGRKLSTLRSAYPPAAFRPGGKALIAYADHHSHIVAIELATERVLWQTPPLPGEWGGVIDLTPDGSTFLALRHNTEGSAWLCRLNVLTGEERGEPIRGWGTIAVAPGGKLAAVGRKTENGEAYIDLVDLPSDRWTASLRADASALGQLLFSPDGKSLYLSASEGDRSKEYSYFGRIWAPLGGDLQTTPNQVRAASPLMAHTTVGAYIPSADRLVTATENLLVVRDATGRVRGSGFPAALGPASMLSPGPDGRTILAYAWPMTACLWQISGEAEPVPDKQATGTASSHITAPRSLYVFAAGLRADGQIAVSLSLDPAGREQVRLADPATGRPLGAPATHHPGWDVRAFAFSPDGRCFATGSYPGQIATGELRLWDTSTGRLLFPPIPYTNFVSAIAFHPDGKLVATGDYSGLVRTWDLATGREIGRPLIQGEIVMALSFSPDGKMLAVGLAKERAGKPGTRLWDGTTRQPIGDLLPSTDHVTRIEFRPDGRALLAGTSRSARLWDTIQRRALTESLMDEGISEFRHDGRAFLTIGGDGAVKLRDATTGEVLGRFVTSSSPATCAAFRGDDGLVAAGFEDGAVRLYDPATNGPVGPPRFLSHAVVRVAFTSAGRSVVAVDALGAARTWPVPEPLDGNLDDLTLRIEARTGLRMETGLALSRLNPAAWQERLEQLSRLDPNATLPDRDPAWHAPLLREAEQNGNAFAAIWHLDRLITARADDWFLYARRGRAWSLSDQLDKAADDFQNAERLSSRERVLDFQAHCVLDCTKAERWAAALWYLDRLIAARPKDWSLHLDRAEVYGKLGREADRQTELARVFELGADEGVVIPRAEELGRAGRWSEAARLLADCGRRGPLSQGLAQAWAIACLQAKDDAGYREACAAVLAWQGSEPTVIWNALSAASVFALGAKGRDDYGVPIAWFERRLSAVPAPSPQARRYVSNALGGLLLRAGRLDEAIVRIQEGIAAAKDEELPTDWTYLALAQAQKGQLAEARQALERLREVRPDPTDTFWDLQQIALLRSEAEALVGSTKEEPKK